MVMHDATKEEMVKKVSHCLSLNVENPEVYRQNLLQAFEASNILYKELFAPLTREAFYKRADRLRHPLIFYYGNTSVFTMNKLVVSNILGSVDRIDDKIESMMAIGVDEMSWDDLPGEDFNCPEVTEVLEYRQKVLERVKRFIEKELKLEANSTIDWDHPIWVLLMCLEHEKIHLETSAVLIRQLPVELFNESTENIFIKNICSKYETDPFVALNRLGPLKLILIDCKGHTIALGRSGMDFPDQQKASYGWDNEFGKEVCELDSNFAISNKMVSNAEFLEFVKAEGYSKAEFWSDEGWKWVTFMKADCPKFWIKTSEGHYKLRLLYSVMENMPWDWPVECNYLEASAYCEYLSMKKGQIFRLIKEEEYMHVRARNDTAFNYEKQEPGLVPLVDDANLCLKKFSSCCPVDEFSILLNDDCLYDLQGNVWEHVRTTMYPFKGFRPHPVYDDFTIPTFDDGHNLILGGSWISCGNEASPYARYAFRRHFYQFAGFRVVRDMGDEKIVEFDSKNSVIRSCLQTDNIYETDSLLHQYVHFHYGGLPGYHQFKDVMNFPEVCADICLALSVKLLDQSDLRVLDIGAGVGRSSFEMAKHSMVEEVVGLDFSTRFILAAQQLKEKGRLQNYYIQEGELVNYHEVGFGSQKGLLQLDGKGTSAWIQKNFGVDLTTELEVNLAKKISKTHFLQGDACNLSKTHPLLAIENKFHVILAANLLDRLYDPALFLRTIGEHLLPGGLLVITSPYTWIEEYCPKDKWLGARRINGENISTYEALHAELDEFFSPLDLKKHFADQSICQELEGRSRNAFSVPFVIQETARKFQMSFAQISVWHKKK